MSETHNQTILRRAKAAILIYQDAEIEARKRLASVEENTKRARAKYEELFMQEEKSELARRKADYRHSTH
jgi:hypothetical protein